MTKIDENIREKQNKVQETTNENLAANPENQPQLNNTSATESAEDDSRPLSDGEKTKMKWISWFGYFICVLCVLKFFSEGGFSLSIWWWIVCVFVILCGYAIKDANRSSMKKNLDSVLGVVMLLLLSGALMHGCMGDDSSSSSPSSSSSSSETSSVSSPASHEDEIPSWIYGVWTCNTPYGTINAVFTEKNGYIDNTDNKSGTFTYDSSSQRISTSTGTFYIVDVNNRRLDAGGGTYMHKR